MVANMCQLRHHLGRQERPQTVGRAALGDVIDAHPEAGSILGREIDPIKS